MGTFSAGISDNDLAMDIHIDFEELYASGMDPDKAVKVLKKSLDADEPSDIHTFWLCLAEKQIELGCLTPSTRKRALQIIDSGKDLEAWMDSAPELMEERAAALEELRTAITGKHQTIDRPVVESEPWRVGDGLAFKLKSGNWIGLRVAASVQDGKERLAYEILELVSDRPLNPKDYTDKRVLVPHFVLGILEGVADEIKLEREKLTRASSGDQQRASSLRVQELEERETAIIGVQCSFSAMRRKPADRLPGRLVKVTDGLEQFRPRDLARIQSIGRWSNLGSILKRNYGIH